MKVVTAGKCGMGLAAITGVMVIGGCGRGISSVSRSSTCTTSEAASVCFVRGSGPNHFEVTGFQPGSEVRVTRDGPANPQVPDPRTGAQPVPRESDGAMQFPIAADGTNGSGVVGIAGLVGPVTFTLSGTSETGTPVVVSMTLGG